MRLALEGFVDVFKVLPRSDLNTLEFSCSTFHSIVSTHMNGVCLVAIGDVRVDHRLGYIVTNCVAKFRAIDEGHADAAPAGQKHFRENVYVLLQRVVSKCFVEMLVVTFPADLDDVAFKALTAIQSNVSCVIVDGRHENTKAIGEEFIGQTVDPRERNFALLVLAKPEEALADVDFSLGVDLRRV